MINIFEMELTSCCSAFDFYISEIGKKGFSILPNKTPTGQFNFILQGRSHNSDDENSNHAVFQRVIHYCPGCGKKLSDLIEENRISVIHLNELHRDLIL